MEAEVLQVVKFVDDASQVAALKALLLRGSAPRAPLNALRGRAARTAGEAIGENLIEDGVLDPVRRLDGHAGLGLYEQSCAPTIPTIVL